LTRSRCKGRAARRALTSPQIRVCHEEAERRLSLRLRSCTATTGRTCRCTSTNIRGGHAPNGRRVGACATSKPRSWGCVQPSS
jgi:hypothetical protein